jgi:mono/diheme cytochrome c family protein
VSVPTWRVFLVEAYPTTFARSPTGFTAASVTRGAALFQEHCTACHGREGRGDGPAAGGGVAPDLTAAHVFDHSEGDLFWWISEGIPRAGMPGFRDAIDDDGRWALVDFVRANAFGRGAADDPDRPATIRAPDFPFECPNGTADTLTDVAAPVVHLTFAPGPEITARAAAAETDIAEIAWMPEDTAAPADACEARGADVAGAYAILAGRSPSALAETEFLITGGWVRAVGDSIVWRDPAVFAAAARQAASTPAPAASAGVHVH